MIFHNPVGRKRTRTLYYRIMMFIILWDVKEPAHLSQRVGHVVPGVVVCLLLYIYHGWEGKKKGALNLEPRYMLCDPHHRLLW